MIPHMPHATDYLFSPTATISIDAGTSNGEQGIVVRGSMTAYFDDVQIVKAYQAGVTAFAERLRGIEAALAETTAVPFYEPDGAFRPKNKPWYTQFYRLAQDEPVKQAQQGVQTALQRVNQPGMADRARNKRKRFLQRLRQGVPVHGQ